jgi:hypothetical protein
VVPKYFASVIVRNLHFFWPAAGPTKYDPPLIVDADRMLAGKAAFQMLPAGFRAALSGHPTAARY